MTQNRCSINALNTRNFFNHYLHQINECVCWCTGKCHSNGLFAVLSSSLTILFFILSLPRDGQRRILNVYLHIIPDSHRLAYLDNSYEIQSTWFFSFVQSRFDKNIAYIFFTDICDFLFCLFWVVTQFPASIV